MRSIVIRITDDQFEWVSRKSTRLGFSPSGFAKYQLLEDYDDGKGIKQYTTPMLINMASQRLADVKVGQTFIVSSLFEPIVWRTLTRSQKCQIAKWLARTVRESNGTYGKIDETSSGVSIYVRTK